MRYPGFVYGTARSQSWNADIETTMNWYPEQLPKSATSPAALYPTPGGRFFAEALADVNFRGGLVAGTRAFAVIGSGFYEIPSVGGTLTKWGTVAIDKYPATLSYNGATGAQVFITSGGNGYLFELLTNTFSQVLTAEATMGGMLDGYFLAFNVINGKVRMSHLNNGTVGNWDPNDYFQRTIRPDPWQAMAVVGGKIWLIGKETGEVWYDSGAVPVPFQPDLGSILDVGIVAPFSIAISGDTLAWVSSTKNGAGVVVRAVGYQPARISDYSFETALAQYQRTSTIDDCEAITYQAEGHGFSIFNFPAANATHVWDMSTTLWHQRGSWNIAANQYDRWYPRAILYAFGKHLVGQANSGRLWYLDATAGDELDGQVIRRQRIAPGLYNEDEYLYVSNFGLYVEPGLGTQTGQGQYPQVMLRISKDAGKTWSSERREMAGAVGQYGNRVSFTRCGIARHWVPEVTVTDPIPWRIVDAFVLGTGLKGQQPQQPGGAA